jgi:two-component system LytT family sensor kinase
MKINAPILLFCSMLIKIMRSVISRLDLNISFLLILLLAFLDCRAVIVLDTVRHGEQWIKTYRGWIYAKDLPVSEVKTFEKAERLKAIAKEHYVFSIGQVLHNGTQSLAVRFQQKTGAIVYEGKTSNWGRNNIIRNFILSRNSNIEFADTKITRSNAKNYRYHVVLNDSKELIGWSTPSTFKMTANGKSEYAYLGEFNTQENGFLKLEIYNINYYSDRDAIIIDWRPVQKPTIMVGVEYQSTKDLKRMLYVPLMTKPKDLNTSFKGKKHKGTLHYFIPMANEVILGDSLIRLNCIINYSGSYKLKAELRRKINGNTDLLQLEDTEGRFLLYKEYWKEPGEYQLTFYPELKHPGGSPVSYFRDKGISYHFIVHPPLNSTKLYTTKQLFFRGIILTFLFAIILIISLVAIRRSGRKKLIQEQTKKETMQLQLSSIRSQLNPHFMFNALAGIQNLMNKNKNEDAAIYLNKFARITRNVLENKEMLSLIEEVRLLEDYLQMERLRFDFNYKINISELLDHENIEIPSMLIQPFVENSVKHGITHKGKPGWVNVTITADHSSLLLKISDNGVGFNTDKSYKGFGLQLSKDRITLLNKIYKETPIFLTMQSDSELTEITITLTNWL